MPSLARLLPAARCNVLAMLHVPALPGTPASSMGMPEILEKVAEETEIYLDAGVDGLVLENMHDTPYCLEQQLGPHIGAGMAVVARQVRQSTPASLPVGVQVLAAANKTALAVAKAAGLQFIRAEGFVFGHLADEGWVEACAGPLLRFRKEIGAEDVCIVCDIKKKHSAHAVTADVSIEETAKAAKFFRADGLIVTGNSTGDPASPQELEGVIKSVPGLPVMIGSGVTPENLQEFSSASALIIGSYFKSGGHWEGALDKQRVLAVVEEARRCRNL